jgi:hypothetical protein
MLLSNLLPSKSKTQVAGGILRPSSPLSELTRLIPDGDPLSPERLTGFIAAAGQNAVALVVDAVADCMPATNDPALSSQAVSAARVLVAAIPDRRLAVGASLRFSAQDPEFQDLVRQGDARRDARHWGEGEHAYWRALSLYPMHSGYRVQYAHCLKEQSKFADAELQYRNALALGNAGADLTEHVHFAAGRSGRGLDPRVSAAIAAYWSSSAPSEDPLAAPVMSSDIPRLGELLIGRSAWSVDETCSFMHKAPLVRDVVALMLERPDFAAANRDLLAMLAETRWGRR